MTMTKRVSLKVPRHSRDTRKDCANPFFNVQEIPLVRVDGVKTNLRALVNEETGKEVGIVTDKYNLFTHKAASDKVKEFLDSIDLPYQSLGVATASVGSRFFENITFPTLSFNPTTGSVGTALDNVGLKADTYQPVIQVRNSYDKSMGLSWTYGLYRIVCSNGMAVKMDEERLSFRHNQIIDTENLHRHLITNIDKTVKLMTEKFPLLNDVNGSHLLQSAISSKFSDKYKKLVLDKLGANLNMDADFAEQDDGSSIWTIKEITTPLTAYAVYNILTEINTHEIASAGERTVNDDRIAVLAGLVA